MAMLEFDHLIESTGSSGALTAIQASFGAIETVMYFSNDTLATTQSISLQTAPDAAGPWVTEASTAISTVGSTSGRFRLTGPFGWIRPYLHTNSTGAYRVRIIGVS
jgi:hypothetical protein